MHDLLQVNGAVLVLAAAMASLALARVSASLRMELATRVVSLAAPAAQCALAIAYLFYPNYSDPFGPTMTASGFALLEGRPVYPPPGDYTFHGLLYGPLLSEIQAAALFAGTQVASLPVMVASKLPGVAAFFLATVLLIRISRPGRFALLYFTVFLLPFQIVPFWNRCEPYFLLLATLGFWSAMALPPRRALVVLGICAGLASALKIHGCLYLAPAIIAFGARNGVTTVAVAHLCTSAVAAFLLCFAPAETSLAGLLSYLRYAGAVGLSFDIFQVNMLFLVALWSPFLVAMVHRRRWHAFLSPGILALGVAEVLVCVVASRPGSGFHHLLPFVPANALLFARYLDAGENAPSPVPGGVLAPVWLATLLPGIVACFGQASGMAANWPVFARAQAEIAEIRAAFPGAVMGVAGDATYPYVYLRPQLGWQGATQVEYSTFMDLHIAGVSEAPLRAALEACEIPLLVLPRGETPFSLTTAYLPGRPLFSDELRAGFQRRYARVAYSARYEVFACSPG